MSVMDSGLTACKEASADPSACRAKRQDGGKAPPIRNATSGNHWHWRNSIHCGRHESHCCDGSPDMAASFPALRNNDIDPGADGALRIGRRAHSVQDNRPAGFRALYQRRRVTPEKGNNRDMLLQADCKSFLLGKFQIQVHSERTRCQSTNFSNLLPNCVEISSPGYQHPERGYIAYSCGKPGANRPTHRRLDDRQLDPKPIAEDSFHPNTALAGDRVKDSRHFLIQLPHPRGRGAAAGW